jgi:transposase
MSDGSKEQPKMTAGLDLGDRYSYLCLIDAENGEVVEEGRLRTTPEALRGRFASERPLRIAIEAGTHSPWVSRVLEGCGHEVLVANSRKLKLIYANKRKTDEVDALRTWLVWHVWIRNCSIRSSIGAKRARPTWRSSAPGRPWSGAARSW